MGLELIMGFGAGEAAVVPAPETSGKEDLSIGDSKGV